MKTKIYIVLALLAMGANNAHGAYKAVIIAPVADLVSAPLAGKHMQQYNRLPLCGGRYNPFESCPRLHQLLFNEIVTVCDQKNDEVCVLISSAFFQTHNSPLKNRRYWTHKNNIVPLAQLDRRKIPPKINFSVKSSITTPPNVISLVEPFYDPTTKHSFSAGTRFVRAPDITRDTCTVYIFNPKNKSFDITPIPKRICIRAGKKNKKGKVNLFVKVLRRWTNSKGFIPYVWGGVSYTKTCKHNSFEHKVIKLANNKKGAQYTRPDATKPPKSGFDCTGVIVRAAQLCDIPYFCKNSTTIQRQLKPLTTEPIESGDIIWISKHVMVVSDVDKNLLIEARGYPHGYGKVHEIALDKVFKGIKTYGDLLTACKQRRPLKRLDIHGKIADTKSHCKIYKLASVFT